MYLVGSASPVPWLGIPHTIAGFTHITNPAGELPSPGEELKRAGRNAHPAVPASSARGSGQAEGGSVQDE